VQNWNALTFSRRTVGIRDLERCLGVSRGGTSKPLTLEATISLSLFDAETRTHRFKVSSVERYAVATVRANSSRHLTESLSGQ
jgi:hypothetical protein